MSDNVDDVPPASPTGDESEPSSDAGASASGPATEPSGNDELKSFMEEYRADKKAAAEAAEAKAKADAEAAAKKKRIPAPEPKKKAEPKPVEPETSEPVKPKAYGSARWFNRKSKPVKE